ncbi:MAG TPA: DUF5020 family protein [Spirochaetota bacterium]|nr:DUF5020 family protein [Spirochaetota bacterium]
MKKMTKVLLVVLLALGLSTTAFAGASGLSIEQHADFDREIFTTTFTGWQADSTGGWFFFLDIDSAAGYKLGHTFNYFEINRDFSFRKLFGDEGLNPLNLHLEYNASTHLDTSYFLTGLKYEISGYPYIFTISASAKLPKNSKGEEPDASWQATAVWSLNFADGAFVFTGFVDVWNNTEIPGGKLAFISEPQVLVNLGKLGLGKAMESFWIGTEFEISKNFVWWDGDDIFVKPTVFIRYDF